MPENEKDPSQWRFQSYTENLPWLHIYDFQLTSRPSPFQHSTERLMWAVVSELAQHRKYCYKESCKACREDEEWLLKGDPDDVFSLENVCWVLRCNVTVVRRLLLGLKSPMHVV